MGSKHSILNVLTPNQAVTRLIAFNETWHDAYLHPNNRARSETVSGWYLSPWNITSDKVSLAFLIHGGPQNSWYNTWGRGWNFQVYAAQGYAVIGINFHGSDSYGQSFTDSITGEYGTLPYEDLQLGLTAILKQKPYIDENRAVALGASYGGFMINWTVGHHRRIMILRT
ncbi:unnamed protein product [Rotaria sordida]|uniref:Peptidase S9 prolyl oligopeptidase catalytic domain-containing protein n=1 Tax=Rotaria sordida TaxID=392033 RepID=A0A814WKL1_9BILA|nr:unnamed protein product [Rotaria sordida]CAF1203748.1 unnamed protein product [Rotaria sordida]